MGKKVNMEIGKVIIEKDEGNEDDDEILVDIN
jgi:hypothetical protein